MRISSRRGCVVAAKRHFPLFRCGSLASVLPLVAAGGKRVQSPADDAPAWRSCYRSWYQWASLAGDDVLHPCPCAGPRCLRSQRRARRPRRAGRAGAPRLRHRPAVAKEPAALPARAQRRGAGGAGPHRPRRQRHRAVPPALGGRAALFHRRRARHGRPRRGHDAAGGGRGGGAGARLPRHPPRSARHQPRGDRALPQERLPRVQPPAQILRGRRRCAAVREAARLPAPKAAPPYIHQTTEFTCGPACMMMALAWAERTFRPAPAALEFQLWREASTVFASSGPGGCEPSGVAVALKRRGLNPEIHVSRPGLYFLDGIRSADRRRVMEVTQLDFRRQAQALGIPTHLTPVNESVLMQAFDAGNVAIVLVSGYHMVPRGKPHWIFAFGRDGRRVLMHDPAALRDDQGMAAAAETYAVPWTAFERVIHLGRERLSAAIVIRKGPS